MQCLVPLAIFALSRTNAIITPGDSLGQYEQESSSREEEDKLRALGAGQLYGSTSMLLILSASAVSAAYTASGPTATLSLGLSHTTLTAIAFMLVERAGVEVRQASQRNGGATHATNGLLMQPPGTEQGENVTDVIRDVSAAAALGTGVAACMLERLPFSFGEMASWGVVSYEDQWLLVKVVQVVLLGLGGVIVQDLVEGGLLIMVSSMLSCIIFSASLGKSRDDDSFIARQGARVHWLGLM